MARLKWDISPRDEFLIGQIVERADLLLDLPIDNRNLTLDLVTLHVNGCALDLAGMLHAGEGDFCHDIDGIRRHIDRRTGRLLRGFSPRYALAARLGVRA